MEKSTSSVPWGIVVPAVLDSLGIPTSIFAYARGVHPLIAFGGLALYLIVVTLGGFAFKVWQQVEGHFVGQTANWLAAAIEDAFSRYYQRYSQQIFFECRFLDIRGLKTQGPFKLLLSEVFVELSVVPQAVETAHINPIQSFPKELQEGRHPIWDYLVSVSLASRHFVILGTPGSGKTTLLKHMALALVAGKHHYRQFKVPYTLPILLTLREHADAIATNPDLSLAKVVCDHLPKDESGKPDIPARWIGRRLNKGRCLILLDGLDEVADPSTRKQVVAWVEKQMQMQRYGKNRFIVTSRPFGYRDNRLGGVAELEVRPFVVEQVERFVQNWYLASEIISTQRDDEGVYQEARKGAADLMRRLRGSEPLLALAVNPLLLTMIATVHRYRSSLPGRRVELYAEICEVFLGHRQQAHDIPQELTPAQKQRILQPLAHHMMHAEQRAIPLKTALDIIRDPLERVSPQTTGEAFLKMIENSSGLLLEQGNGDYRFAHLTFQEYLAATHLKEKKEGEPELVSRVAASWWHETIRLYCAQSDATTIIAACLDNRPLSPAVLSLAIECNEEALEVQTATRARLETLLVQGLDDPDPERARLVAEARLTRRLRQLEHSGKVPQIDTSLVTSAEYQLFLDEQRARNQYFQPDHWADVHFPEGQGNAPILGMRPSDAEDFCAWLTKREPGQWSYRLTTAGEVMGDNTRKWPSGGLWARAEEGGYVFIGKLASAITAAMLEQRMNDDLVRARDLDRAFALVRLLDLARNHILARDLDRALDLDNTLSLAYNHVVSVLNDFDRARDLICPLELARHRYLAFPSNFDQARARDLAHSLDLDRAFNDILAKASGENWKEVPTFLRWGIRFSVLAWLEVLLKDKLPPRTWRERFIFRRLKRQEETAREQIIALYLDLYIDFVILEERVAGTLQPFEGILLARELAQVAT